jgi:hypothetical protein
MIKQRMYIFVNKRLLYILFIIFIKFNKQTKTDFSGHKNYRKVGHGDWSAAGTVWYWNKE